MGKAQNFLTAPRTVMCSCGLYQLPAIRNQLQSDDGLINFPVQAVAGCLQIHQSNFQ